MFSKRYQLKKNVFIILNKEKNNAKIFNKNKNITAYLNKDALEIVTLLNAGLSTKEIFKKIQSKYNKEKKLKNIIENVIELLKSQNLLKKFNKNEIYSNRIRETACSIPIINIQIAVTDKCNMKCKHCYDYQSRSIKKDEMPLDKIKDIIQQSRELGVVQFDITGGEPLLRNDILQIAKLLKENNFEMGLFTNATLLTSDMIDKLIGLEINEFRISLDGFEDNHNKFRGLNNAYEKTLEAIEYINKTKTNLTINVIVNSLNKNEIVPFLNFLTEKKLKSKIDTIIPQGNATNNNQLILSDDNYCQSLLSLYTKKSKYYKYNKDKLNIDLRYRDHIKKKKLKMGCGVGNRILFIDSNGDVKFCPTLPQILGNIYKKSLKDIWEGINILQREELQCKYLEDCVYGLICAGGCRSRAFEFTGKLDAPDTYECKLLKQVFGYDSYWHLK